MEDRSQSPSPAVRILRASVRRLLSFIDAECEKRGGEAKLYDDELARIGTSRVFRSGCKELASLGFYAHSRENKISTFVVSHKWRDIKTLGEAALIINAAHNGQKPRKAPATMDVASTNA